MRNWLYLSTVFASVSLAACAAERTGAPGAGIGDEPVPSARDCPVYESEDWSASLTQAADGAYMLDVKGTVMMPTPGYRYNWTTGAADRRQPPGVDLALWITSTLRPDQVVAQVITPMDVVYRSTSPYSEYRVIRVKCGDRILMEFENLRAKK